MNTSSATHELDRLADTPLDDLDIQDFCNVTNELEAITNIGLTYESWGAFTLLLSTPHARPVFWPIPALRTVREVRELAERMHAATITPVEPTPTEKWSLLPTAEWTQHLRPSTPTAQMITIDEKPIQFIRLTMQLVDTERNRNVMDAAMRRMRKAMVEGPYASIKREHIDRMELAVVPKQEESK